AAAILGRRACAHPLLQLGNSLLYGLPPVRIRGRIGDQLAVALERAGEIAVLLLRKRQPEARLGLRRLELRGPREGAPRLFRDYPAAGEHSRRAAPIQPPR